MDLTPPPPSYEAATSKPGIHNQINPYPKSAPPTASPPQNDEIPMGELGTSPILVRPYIADPYVQPYNQDSYPVTSPTPQTNEILRREASSKTNLCHWCIVVIILISLCIAVLMMSVAKNNKTKPKYDFSQISETNHNAIREFEEKWWQENEEMLKDIKDRGTKFLQDRRDNSHLWNND